MTAADMGVTGAVAASWPARPSEGTAPVNFGLPAATGEASIDSGGAHVGSDTTLTFRYAAPPGGVPAGGTVTLRLPAGQLKPVEQGQPDVSASRPHELLVEGIPGPSWMTEPITWRYVVRFPQGLLGGEQLVLRLDVRIPLYAALTIREAFMAPSAMKVRDLLYRCELSWPGVAESVRAHLPVPAGEPMRLVAVAASASAKGELVRVRVRWEDRFNNWLTESPVAGLGRIEGPDASGLTLERALDPVCPGSRGWDGSASWRASTACACAGATGRRARTPSPLTCCRLRSTSATYISIPATAAMVSGIPSWPWKMRGSATAWTSRPSRTTTPGPESWRDVAGYVDAAHEPGCFATLYGFEHSIHGKEWGNRNVIFRGRHPDTSEADHELPWKIGREYAEGEFLAIPHHVNTTNRTDMAGGEENLAVPLAWQHVDWSGERPEHVPVVEIVQGRGSFEDDTLDSEWGIARGPPCERAGSWVSSAVRTTTCQTGSASAGTTQHRGCSRGVHAGPGEFENLWDSAFHTDVRCALLKQSFDALALAVDVGPRQVARF